MKGGVSGMAWHKLLIEMGMGVDQHGQSPRMLAKKPFWMLCTACACPVWLKVAAKQLQSKAHN